jgi:opacity protein-like surface antigen
MAHNGQRLRGLLVSSAALILLASPASAADDQTPSSPTSSQTASAPANPDFMLGRPRVMIGVRGNWMMASASSDLFDFVTDTLTVEKDNFNTGTFSVEMAVNVTSHLDILAGFDIGQSTTPSEYRDFIDNRGLPIQQTTEFKQNLITASARFSLIPRGREISRFAWIPRTFVPYVGAGSGVTNYRFQQYGDFVDFADNHVFGESFTSDGWTPIVQAFGGTDIKVYKRLYMSLEGRYTWANTELDQDFIDFAPIDLGGFRFGVGIHYAF